jgi:anthranilate synthase
MSSSLRLVLLAAATAAALAFTTQPLAATHRFASTKPRMSSSVDSDTNADATTFPDFNAVEVAKTGGQGMATASQQAVAQDLSLGAPRGRPDCGQYVTKGGIGITANVEGLEFTRTGDQESLENSKSSEAVIESLVQKLDSHKGVLLTSSYEFPGRYARWSLGFIDPPLEVSGKADQCTIKALNDRGKILLPAIEQAMQAMKEEATLSDVNVVMEEGGTSEMVQIDVTIVPPPPVGTFSEEERSRQVRGILYFV